MALFFLITDVDGPGWLQDRPLLRLEVAVAIAFVSAVLHEATKIKRSDTSDE